MKKVLLVLLLSFNLSHVWAFDLNEDVTIQQYNEFNHEDKQIFKQKLKNNGWGLLFSSNDSKFYLNYNYVKNKSSGIVEAWVKSVIIKDIEKDGLSLGDYSMQLISYDCSNDKVKYLSNASYNHKTKNVINSYDVSTSYRYDYIQVIPGSIAEVQLQEACIMAYIKAN